MLSHHHWRLGENFYQITIFWSPQDDQIRVIGKGKLLHEWVCSLTVNFDFKREQHEYGNTC